MVIVRIKFKFKILFRSITLLTLEIIYDMKNLKNLTTKMKNQKKIFDPEKLKI